MTLQSPRHTYEVTCDMIDVTSIHRPDVGRVFKDAAGHEHRWLDEKGAIPSFYNPSVAYSVPSVHYVRTGTGYWPDGEEYPIGHYECNDCGAKVIPAYTADDCQQFIPGLKRFILDGRTVTYQKFRAAAIEEGLVKSEDIPEDHS